VTTPDPVRSQVVGDTAVPTAVCDGRSDDGLCCHRPAGHDGWHVHYARTGQTAWPNTARTAP
jgi:hypothetical protein